MNIEGEVELLEIINSNIKQANIAERQWAGLGA